MTYQSITEARAAAIRQRFQAQTTAREARKKPEATQGPQSIKEILEQLRRDNAQLTEDNRRLREICAIVLETCVGEDWKEQMREAEKERTGRT